MTLRRNICWLGVLSVVAALIATVQHNRFVAGPACDGAPLNVWLRLLDDPVPKNRDQARHALRLLGPAALPLIGEWLVWKDSWPRRLLTAWLTSDEQRFNFHPLTPQDRRRLALDACDVLGPAARPLIPRLVTLASASNPELDAPFLIACIGGSNAPPALARLSASNHKFIRAAAVVSADLLRNHSPLLASRSDADEEVRYQQRLSEYHSRVTQAVISGSAGPPAAPR